MFKGDFKWEIKKMQAENEFMITFPSENIGEQLSRFKSFDFQTAAIKATMIPSDLSLGADGNIDVVWVKAFNFPPKARTVEVVMEVAYIVGDHEEVDLSTLNKSGAVRIKLACRDYREIKGETQVFFNGESHRIRWVVEASESSNIKNVSHNKFDRRKNKEGEEDKEEERDDSSFDHDLGYDKQAGGSTTSQLEKNALKLAQTKSRKYL
ncbi:hypothetical protein C2845_PM03G18580 [Panicum miliaceum]|uniref:DUF4283 domain-containing protein n=1 Tax=Panicum miliaceum TaxID=4540 RepID=A0A3L6T8M4_PANMI|nr:hypothetical protein C2845_PM03G18580 [Panicum miliaceum]